MAAEIPKVNWDELPASDAMAILAGAASCGDGTAISGFMDTHQWLPLATDPKVTIFGGHDSAQFRRVMLGGVDLPIEFSSIKPDALPENARSARGLRMYLRNHGVLVHEVGDIVAGEYLHLCNLPGALSNHPEFQMQIVPQWSPPKAKLQRFTIAANRLDAFVSSAFRVGRAEAQVAIKQGFVFVDFSLATKRTHHIHAGSQVIFRTKGRSEIYKLDLNPRSGRLIIEASHFPV